MAAAGRCISALHARLLRTHDPDTLSHLLLLLLPRSAPTTSTAPSLSYARAIFADHAPLAHAFPWNALIRAHALFPHHAPDALSLFVAMHRRGVPPDHHTFPYVLRACSLLHTVGLRSGTAAHALAAKRGLLYSPVHASNALVSFYGCHGLPERALQMFGEIPQRERDAVSWSALVDCMVSNGLHGEAVGAFRVMQASGLAPDEASMVTAAWAAGKLGSPELAAWAYCYVRRSGLRVTVALGTALLAALAGCGRINLAAKLFDEIPERNVASWTAMVSGLAAHGRGKEALGAFHRMVGEGFMPDHVAFIGALTACAREGLLEEGMRLFASMERDYKVVPRTEHYGCIVDLLGRAGYVTEAHKFVEAMPIRPGPVVWRTLLGACVRHGYVDLAEHVRLEIAEIDPGHDGDYVLLSNVYGGIGWWTAKARVRSEMSGLRVAKTPGLSIPAF